MVHWVRGVLVGTVMVVVACGAQGTHVRAAQSGIANDSVRLATAEYALGIKAYKEKNWAVALAHIQRALAIVPDNHDYRYWQGVIFYQKADYTAALSTLATCPFLCLVSRTLVPDRIRPADRTHQRGPGAHRACARPSR